MPNSKAAGFVGKRSIFSWPWCCFFNESLDKKYSRTRFDSNGLTAAKIAAENDRHHWNSL